MSSLQEMVTGYLKSADFNILDSRDGFLVADQLRLGESHDTRLIWIVSSVPSNKFKELEENLLREFETVIPQYPNAIYSLLTSSLAGFSRDFRSELSKLRVEFKTPVLFFDSPFKCEITSETTKSAIDSLRNDDLDWRRIEQPFSILVGDEVKERGHDLLKHLLDDMQSASRPCLRIIIGPAGMGKTILFRSLFARLYKIFQENKNKRRAFPRPIPFIPEYFRGYGPSSLRTDDLVNSFLSTEIAARILPATFEWMLSNGFAMWLFDGLDELYAGDKEFFDYLLDLLTREGEKTQIVICARDSLLRSCGSLADFLEQYHLGASGEIRVYRLDNWEHSSKRKFAWVSLENRAPKDEKEDSSKVSKFLSYISRPYCKELSSIPFYCNLLVEEFKEGNLENFSNDIMLIGHVISEMIKREQKKGLLSIDSFEVNGLNEWLETIALQFYDSGFSGVQKSEIESFAELTIRNELSDEERQSIIISLTQFPLFSSGRDAGLLVFKHELIAEYLAGRCLSNNLMKKPIPIWVVRSLESRINFTNSLVARYIANHLTKEKGIPYLVGILKEENLPGKSFANFLEILLLADPAMDVITKYGINLERRDLSYVEFVNRNLNGLSLTKCNLSDTLFRNCTLQDSRFGGAHFVGTRFENMGKGALQGAQFGKTLDQFQVVFVGKRRVDDLHQMIKWIHEETGIKSEIHEPCPAALQLRILFRKFINFDGTPRRAELSEIALCRGKQYRGAPEPQDCIKACQRFGYLQATDKRGRIKRNTGEPYSAIIQFVKDQQLSPEMRQLLNSLCNKVDCGHVPK